MNKPNILILYSDQHNARVMGCAGDRQAITPNLDRLADEGVRFSRAITQNPICTPSRMCLMSGQYVHNFGYYGLMGPAPRNLPNLFAHFRQAGYRTGMAGKTHTPSGWLGPHCDDLADGYGFEQEYLPGLSHLLEGLQGLSLNEYATELAQAGLLQDRDDKILQEWHEQKQGHASGQGLDARPSRLPAHWSFEAWTARKVSGFIAKSQAAGQPFCYWMTLPRPHQTYAPAREYWDLYQTDELVLPPNADDPMQDRHPAARRLQENFQTSQDWMIFEPKTFAAARRRVLHGYYANVTQMDAAIGEVLATLDTLKIRDNTIVVYLSDHGEFAGEHGMIEKAPGIGFRCVTQIPLIFSWPGQLPQGKTCDELAESIDVFPTLCRLAGIGQPDWIDGQDLTATLHEGLPVHEVAVTEHALTKTIHTKRWKLTQYLPELCAGQDFGELYDHEADPWELHNLYFDPEHQAVVRDLQQKLYAWLVRTTRPVTVHTKPAFADGEHENTWDDPGPLLARDGKARKEALTNLLQLSYLNYL